MIRASTSHNGKWIRLVKWNFSGSLLRDSVGTVNDGTLNHHYVGYNFNRRPALGGRFDVPLVYCDRIRRREKNSLRFRKFAFGRRRVSQESLRSRGCPERALFYV